MNANELDRLTLMRELGDGRLTQRQAAQLLGVSERQVRHIVWRYEREGPEGLIHRSRGRPSTGEFGAETHAENSMSSPVFGHTRSHSTSSP